MKNNIFDKKKEDLYNELPTHMTIHNNIYIDFVSECAEVTNVEVSELTNSSAVLTWANGNKETKWNIKVYQEYYRLIESIFIILYELHNNSVKESLYEKAESIIFL